MKRSTQKLPPIPPDLFAAERARRSLLEFVRQGWHILEPKNPFQWGWHIEAICEHLEAATRGEIQDLIINMPPRRCKSLLVSVFWPVWEWISRPDRRYICASYSERLAIRDSRKRRRIIQSEWFQSRWGHIVQLDDDQNQKVRFDNSESGFMIATSVGGIGTGEGGERIIVDDAHNAQDAESDAVREATLRWWDETMTTRSNNPNETVRVIIMQRLHQDDLAGHLLKKGGWEHLCLPERFEGEKKPTCIGWVDPREKEGDLLWPERFNEAAVEKLERSLGALGVAGQLQQRPVPRGGAFFRVGRLEIADAAPAVATRVRYWDKAATKGGGAYTCGVLMARDANGLYWIEDVWREQQPFDERNASIRQVAALDHARYGGTVSIWTEQEPGSGGKESAQISVRELAGYTVSVEPVTGDKATRALPLASQIAAGNVKMVRGDWNDAFLAEMRHWPHSRYKDQGDAAAGAFNKLALGGGYVEADDIMTG